MRLRAVLLTLVCLAVQALAGDDRGPRRRPDVDVIVPVDPYEQNRMYWKNRRTDRDLVPPMVSIDGESPYVCDLDDEKFDERDRFVAHLRIEHGVPRDRIPDLLVPLDGVIHFVGE